MTVATARLYVQQFAKTPSGDTSIYSLSDVDRVIKAIGDDIILATECVRANATVAYTVPFSSVNGLILSNSASDFRAERVIKAWIPGAPTGLKFRNDQDIRNLIATEGRTGTPEMIAWLSFQTATLYPTPTVDGSVSYEWLRAFTTWTDGAVDGTTIATVLNLPDEYIRLGLMYGCTALLQHHEPEMLFTSPSWQKYEQWRDKLAIRIRGRQNPIRLSQGAMILES